MGRRKSTIEEAGRAQPLPATPRVLIVSDSRPLRESVLAGLSSRVPLVTWAESTAEALRMVAENEFEVVLIRAELPDEGAYDLTQLFVREHPGAACIILAQSPGLDVAVRAMRSGAADVIDAGAGAEELHARVLAAAARCAELRAAEATAARRCQRLQRLCRTLNKSRRELLEQVTSLCDDLAGAHKDMAAQLEMGTLSSEFNTIIRQELEIEGLLRTVLEYLLPRTGPTNAAIFLPASSGDFSLGAYVNYDCPKDTAEVLLEHLAATLAPAFERERGVVSMASREELVARMGPSADWLDDSGVVAFSCRHEDECLAVVALFRDRRTPFPPAMMPMLGTVRDLFARQLGRVIHTHHRHLPKDKWGWLGDESDGLGDIDLAA